MRGGRAAVSDSPLTLNGGGLARLGPEASHKNNVSRLIFFREKADDVDNFRKESLFRGKSSWPVGAAVLHLRRLTRGCVRKAASE